MLPFRGEQSRRQKKGARITCYFTNPFFCLLSLSKPAGTCSDSHSVRGFLITQVSTHPEKTTFYDLESVRAGVRKNQTGRLNDSLPASPPVAAAGGKGNGGVAAAPPQRQPPVAAAGGQRHGGVAAAPPQRQPPVAAAGGQRHGGVAAAPPQRQPPVAAAGGKRHGGVAAAPLLEQNIPYNRRSHLNGYQTTPISQHPLPYGITPLLF